MTFNLSVRRCLVRDDTKLGNLSSSWSGFSDFCRNKADVISDTHTSLRDLIPKNQAI